jgi:thiol-disulfide isomerase/thioredoxin
MRMLRSSLCLLILALGLGCSQTGVFRPSAPPSSNVRTIASVGDKPLPIVAGEPGSSLRAETEEPEPPRTSNSRVSGRVYNDRGKPVPGVRVRLALGGAAGGKVIGTTTDRSGAFTLHGLRPGTSYTLIAEFDGNAGAVTGRAQVKAPQTDVRIALSPSDDEAGAGHASIRPARPKVEPISNVDPMDDDATEGDDGAVRINFEDIGPPAAEATSLRPEQNVQISRSSAPGDGPKPKKSTRGSWTSRRDSSASGVAKNAAGRGDGEGEGDDNSDDAKGNVGSGASRDSRANQLDDGPNPLPPALEPSRAGAMRSSSTAEDEPVRVARATSQASTRSRRQAASTARARSQTGTTIDSDDADDARTKPNSEDPAPGEQVIKPGAFGPIRIGDRADANAHATPPERPSRAQTPAPASDDDEATPPNNDAPGSSGAASAPRRPTWGELTARQGGPPVDESLRRVSTSNAVADGRVITLTSATAATEPKSLFDRLFGGSRPKRDEAIKQSLCQFDPIEERLVDVQLPAIDGKWVSLRAIDADVILLAFWGSWCTPCRQSTEHLVELQSKLASKRFKVVAIACEKGASAGERQAEAAKAATELGINYPVLVTTKGISCPVQKALQVQFYPTLVLLDRNGHILARELGATETTLSRMDRAVTTALASSADRRASADR